MTPQRLKIFLTLSLSLNLAVITGCLNRTIPKWEGRIYAGDSSRGGIARTQDESFIGAHDPRFNEYLAMSYSDFREFYRIYVLGCEKWKNQPMGSERELFLANPDALLRTLHAQDLATTYAE